MWDPAAGSGTDTSAVYGGDPLTIGQTYYARVRANDGELWGDWAETPFQLVSPAENVPPTADPVTVTDLTSPTPTISWVYFDPEGAPQAQYEVEVWTGPNGTGTTMWDPAAGSGTDTSAVYDGDPLTVGETYYARVRANDGELWGDWAETPFVTREAAAIPGLSGWGLIAMIAVFTLAGAALAIIRPSPARDRNH